MVVFGLGGHIYPGVLVLNGYEETSLYFFFLFAMVIQLHYPQWIFAVVHDGGVYTVHAFGSAVSR